MKTFKTAGACIPERNYMVDLSSRIEAIKAMVDQGLYFTINRARQYGKTTTLTALAKNLHSDYTVLSLSFQGISSEGFKGEYTFVKSFYRLIRQEKDSGLVIPAEFEQAMDKLVSASCNLDDMFGTLTMWCRGNNVVLIIDEVDAATNFQVFMDFLAHLRDGYLRRETKGAPAFQSVILAGVTDVKNIKRKLRPDEDSKFNSPWNIAADFNVDMSFNTDDIAGMLKEYETDHHTGMDIKAVAQAIEDCTSGYPFLVSRICQLLDGDNAVQWNKEGVGEIVRRILMEKNTLFDSLMGKVHDNHKLRKILYRILFAGESISYNPDDLSISDAEMFGFIRNNVGIIQITNQIFETRLYNFFLSQEELNSPIYQIGVDEKKQFIKNGRLDMDHVLERYAIVYDDLYGNSSDIFDETQGRLRFLLFIRPIINGTGHYHVEEETRDRKRMDLVIDYHADEFVIELKIWRGQKYHADGEKQLCRYLESKHLDKGYMLTYSFKKRKETGMERKTVDGKELIEVLV